MGRLRKLVGLLLVGLILTSFVGCGKISQDNYDKISNGMTVSEVQGILARPDDTGSVSGGIGDVGGSVKKMVWGNDAKAITVTFVNDKVTAKSAKGL